MALHSRDVARFPVLPKLIEAIEAFRRLDPEMPAQTILAFLLVAEAMPDGALQNELGIRLNLSPSAIQRNITFLSHERSVGVPGHNLVNVEIVPENKRLRRVRLTATGERLAENLHALLG